MNLIHRQHMHSVIRISSFLCYRATKIEDLLDTPKYYCPGSGGVSMMVARHFLCAGRANCSIICDVFCYRVVGSALSLEPELLERSMETADEEFSI